ncbi:cupin domain-containing protein [Herbaspirillum seropedicae]|uniref:cupin domain-containing protein n=1 Tax=Herbaspirillum seropedicae TaxID=964 RepID=UPI0011234187|nr:cupin domain-containing protein [Herbaspirillum seropedicae]QDD67077.1 cupin domain-containing protein [Herbaspirillum seropedicae]
MHSLKEVLSAHPRSSWLLGALIAVSGVWYAVNPASASGNMPAWLAEICGGTQQIFSTPVNSAGASARPATTTKILSCEKLADMPGKSVTTMLVSFPPLAYTPAHRHPGSVTAFVVKGTVRSQMAGTPAQTYPAGSNWFEPAMALHMFAENPSATQAAELLVMFVTEDGCGPLVIPEARG